MGLVAAGAAVVVGLQGFLPGRPVEAPSASPADADRPVAAQPTAAPARSAEAALGAGELGGSAGLAPASSPGALTAPTPVEVAAPSPKPAPSGAFVQHGVAHVASSFYVLGVVTNTSPYTVDRPRVHVVLLDAEDREVGARQAFGWGPLAPDEVMPLAVLVHEPPPHASFRCELELREASYLPEPAAGLRLAPLPAEETRFGWALAGAVVNEGAETARFVEVRVAGYDAEDRLVGVTRAYAAGKEGLAPGAQARYRTVLRVLSGRPARFDLTVVGRR